MRVLVQRVTSAAVRVDGSVVGAVRPETQGLLALVGVTHDDDPGVARRMAEKLWQLRILDNEKSASDIGAPILVVSQFTLYANTVKGRRPSWNAAAPAAVAELAPFLGRLVVADEKAARASLSPGCVFPVVNHGGPGRAGGGGELGGRVGMELYMQRTTIQGGGSQLARLLGKSARKE